MDSEIADEIIENLQQPSNHKFEVDDNDDDNNFSSPFFLELKVVAAEYLPIADITTSDPYVVVYVGGRRAGTHQYHHD